MKNKRGKRDISESRERERGTKRGEKREERDIEVKRNRDKRK